MKLFYGQLLNYIAFIDKHFSTHSIFSKYKCPKFIYL